MTDEPLPIATSPYLNKPLRTIEQAKADLIAKPMTATGIKALAAHIYLASDNGRRK